MSPALQSTIQEPVNVVTLSAKIMAGETATVTPAELVAMAAAISDFDPALSLASEAIVLITALGQRPDSKDLRRAADDTLVRLREKLKKIGYYNWEGN